MMEVKSLSNDDSKKAADLILPIQQLEFNVPITLKDQPDLLEIDRYYIKPGGGFWGAFAENQLIGTIALINIGEGAGVIRKMFVKKEYRGKELKIAQVLIETLFAFAEKNAITQLYLGTVGVMYAAHRFYERNGFQKIDPEDLPAHFPRMATDTIFYHRNNTPQ